MTEQRPVRERLRELAGKATPGGWDAPIQVEHGDYGSVLSQSIEAVEAADGRPVCVFHDDYGHDSWADATYIAACDPDTIKALLDELNTLERRAEAAEGWLAILRSELGWLADVKCDCPPDYTKRGRHRPFDGCLVDELRLSPTADRSLITSDTDG